MLKFYKQIITILLTSLLLSHHGFSQNISGTWEGNYGWTLFAMQPSKLVVEINVYNDSLISGASHLYYRNNKYEHYRIRGVFHKKDSTLIFREDSTIGVKLGLLATNSLGTYKMKLKVSDTLMRQDGKWKENVKLLRIGSSTVWLEKKIILPKKDTLTKQENKIDSARPIIPEKVLARETDIQSLLEIPNMDKDSIKIEIYDNGIVDDDSVSVYIDNKETIQRQRISNTALLFYISLDNNNPIRNIRFVAESLGSIPPCTGVMIVTTKHKRYEISLSSNLDKNATVELFLKE